MNSSFSSLGRAASGASFKISNPLDCCFPKSEAHDQGEESEQESLVSFFHRHQMVQQLEGEEGKVDTEEEQNQAACAVLDTQEQLVVLLKNKKIEIKKIKNNIFALPSSEKAKELLSLIQEKEEIQEESKRLMHKFNRLQKEFGDQQNEQIKNNILQQQLVINTTLQQLHKRWQQCYQEIKTLTQKINDDPSQQEIAKLLNDLKLAKHQVRELIRHLNWLDSKGLDEWTRKEIKEGGLDWSDQGLTEHTITIPSLSVSGRAVVAKNPTNSILKKDSSFKQKPTSSSNQPINNKKITIPTDPEELDDGGMSEIFRDVGDDPSMASLNSHNQ